MYHLATLFPALKQRTLLLSRDQVVLLLVAVNQFFLSLDTYLVHVLNGTILLREWIPIGFGIIAGVILLLAGLIAIRRRDSAALLSMGVFIVSVLVGIAGAYFHFIRGIQPTAPVGSRVTLDLLAWAPPILAPFAFAGVGLMGMSAAWVEQPADSGRLRIFGRILSLPFSKTQAYLFYTCLGILVALVSSILDHVRHGFEHPSFWIPTVTGIFATVVTLGLALLTKPQRTDIGVYVAAMLLLIVTGVLGAWFHIEADLTANSQVVIERFLRGAPVLSPLLFSNMGMIGLVVLLDPASDLRPTKK